MEIALYVLMDINWLAHREIAYIHTWTQITHRDMD